MFAVFWDGCKHKALTRLLVLAKPIIVYIGLWHTWAVFSNPLKVNRKLLLDIEYDNGEKEMMNLFDYEDMQFFDRKANTFDTKYVESLFKFIQIRTNFAYYIKNYIDEKNENKKVKNIKFIGEFKEIKLWGPCLDPSNFVVLSSHEV